MLRLQRVDDDHLVLGRDAGKDGNLLYLSAERLDGHLVQILPGQNRIGRGQPQFLGDGHSRQGMISGDHNRAYPGLPAHPNGLNRFGTHRIEHAGHTQKDQVLLVVRRLVQFIDIYKPISQAKHPNAVFGHRSVFG